jgi:hypothetical protein
MDVLYIPSALELQKLCISLTEWTGLFRMIMRINDEFS